MDPRGRHTVHASRVIGHETTGNVRRAITVDQCQSDSLAFKYPVVTRLKCGIVLSGKEIYLGSLSFLTYS